MDYDVQQQINLRVCVSVELCPTYLHTVAAAAGASGKQCGNARAVVMTCTYMHVRHAWNMITVLTYHDHDTDQYQYVYIMYVHSS